MSFGGFSSFFWGVFSSISERSFCIRERGSGCSSAVALVAVGVFYAVFGEASSIVAGLPEFQTPLGAQVADLVVLPIEPELPTILAGNSLGLGMAAEIVASLDERVADGATISIALFYGLSLCARRVGQRPLAGLGRRRGRGVVGRTGIKVVVLRKMKIFIEFGRAWGRNRAMREISRALLRSTDDQAPTYLWLLPSSGTRPGVLAKSSTRGGRIGTASCTASTRASSLKRVGNSSILGFTPNALSITGNMKALDEIIITERAKSIPWSDIRDLVQ